MPINKPQVFGLITLFVGFGLIMGGAMLLLVSLITPKFGEFCSPAAVQIMLGILGAVAGILFWYQSAVAKYVAGLAVLGVVANVVFLLSVFARLMPQ